MRFLTRPECEEFVSRVGLDHSDVVHGARLEKMKNAAFFFYDDPLKTSRAIADRLVAYIGEFSWSLLWVYGLVFGDRSEDKGASDPWRRYARWRKAAGGVRRIFDAPGHLFEAGEHVKVAEAIELSIAISAWDAVVVARPSRCLVTLSHDELVAVQSRHNLTALSRDLSRIGVRREEFFDPQR